MKNIVLLGLVILALIAGLLLAGCAKTEPTVTEENPQIIAETFVKAEATYTFDGMPETLKLAGISLHSRGGVFTYEFDSRHAGYGDRTGQILAQVVTQHKAVISVEDSKVKSAVMDEVYDMVNRGFLNNVEIRPAPIDEVNILFMESYPVQIGVYIKGGLPDGCTTFRDLTVTRTGDTINIEVKIQKPADAVCPAIYTWFEKNVNLGSEFTAGNTYTVKVNDVSTTFTYP